MFDESELRLILAGLMDEIFAAAGGDSSLEDRVNEIVRKCGDKWCLYTKKKDKKTGRRRRLGTHDSKAAAYRQERAVKAHGG